MKRRWWHRLVSPSTQALMREARETDDYNLVDFLHGYFYGRWTYFYIGFGIGEHRLAKMVRQVTGLLPRLKKTENGPAALNTRPTFAEGYHGKVVPLPAAKQLVMVNEPVRLKNLEHIIPYTRARDIVLKNPEHIVVLECPCRVARPDPCLPLDVCLIIGEPFASFVTEHHASRSRRIDREEAVAILQAEDERGHVHHAFFKDAMLGRFYAICNCCTCCCGAMQAHRKGTPMLASSGYLAHIDEDLCIGCGECREYCQFEALCDGSPVTQVDTGRCMGCGVCVSKCVEGAVSLERAEERGIPLEIHQLMLEASR